MKHGVTYLNHNAYQRYKFKRALLNLMRPVITWLLITAIGCSGMVGLGSLIIRAIDIEYNMQLTNTERFLTAGDFHDNKN
ncbi:hypothetical protein [Acinetobacter colistiniresistens]|uniref:hypothetical protein n=1 Tax=Acinetobacter colistiniresistens TaxID=280145 RepID=UPI00124FA6B3|nr:hypothetical protein [Acinetobacter colistiniresistens]